jgi:aminoglycoside phosphotransferase (APT) family kinase protein
MTDKSCGAPVRARMHDGEVFADAATVHRLLKVQFPYWADLPLTPVSSTGTSNALYRLGPDMAVRLPLQAYAQPEREYRWLSRIASQLPIAVSLPLGLGVPGEGYPWAWSICRWLEGDIPDPERLDNPLGLAGDLAAFIAALRAIDPADGPGPRIANYGRGAPLAGRDKAVRDALATLGDTIDVSAAAASWDDSLAAPVWSGAPTWLHGDLNPGNLIVKGGCLAGVIDFGCLAVGDPACDLLAAWYVFPADARSTFRAALNPDDASWRRGRGWALSMALIALPYYRDTNPWIMRNALRVVCAVLEDG